MQLLPQVSTGLTTDSLGQLLFLALLWTCWRYVLTKGGRRKKNSPFKFTVNLRRNRQFIQPDNGLCFDMACSLVHEPKIETDRGEAVTRRKAATEVPGAFATSPRRRGADNQLLALV